MPDSSSKTIRATALDLLSLWKEGDGRADLTELCGGDEALAAEVRRAAEAVARLEQAAARFEPAATLRAPPGSATQVGPASADQPQAFEVDAPGRRGKPGGSLPAIPGYTVERLLGRGGMGAVYEARHQTLGRTVAIKMIRPDVPTDDEELQRFRTEAEAVAKLQHPNIVQIFEVGEAEGRPWFALEYVAGGSLAQRIQGRPQSPREAAALVQTLAAAMQACHDRGIIHRDLKPANVLLTQSGGEVVRSRGGDSSSLHHLTTPPPHNLVPKIADFGLAKSQDSELTKTGSILGTPSYMAPEQAAGAVKAISPACDQYALGAILYHLLTGRPPFLGATAYETVDLVLRAEPAPPRRLVPAVPADLETICLKALRKASAGRYPSCADLAADLGRFLKNEPIQARPVGAGERALRWAQRNPAVAGLLGAVALLLVGSIAALSWFLFRVSEESQAKGQALQAALQAKAELQAEQRETAKTLWHVVFDVNRGLATQPGAQELRLKLLKEALGRALRIDPTAETMEGVHHSQVGAHNDLGDLLKEMGQTETARQQFAAALVHARRLAAAKPDDAHYQDEIFVSAIKLHDMRLAQGDVAAALAHYRQALERFKNDDGKVKSRIHQRCHVLHRLALALLDAERWDEAAATGATLLAAESGAFPPMVILAHRAQGDAALKKPDLAAARGHFQNGIVAARKLFAERDDAESRRLLAELLARAGDAEFQLGKQAEAESLEREALALLVAPGKPIHPSHEMEVAATREKLATLALARGQVEPALALLKEAEPTRRKQAEDATNVARQVAVARHLTQQATVFERKQDTPAARQARAEAAALWTKLEREGKLRDRPRLQQEAKHHGAPGA